MKRPPQPNKKAFTGNDVISVAISLWREDFIESDRDFDTMHRLLKRASDLLKHADAFAAGTEEEFKQAHFAERAARAERTRHARNRWGYPAPRAPRVSGQCSSNDPDLIPHHRIESEWHKLTAAKGPRFDKVAKTLEGIEDKLRDADYPFHATQDEKGNWRITKRHLEVLLTLYVEDFRRHAAARKKKQREKAKSQKK